MGTDQPPNWHFGVREGPQLSQSSGFNPHSPHPDPGTVHPLLGITGVKSHQVPPLCPFPCHAPTQLIREMKVGHTQESFALLCRGLYLSRTHDTGSAFPSQVLLNPIDFHGCPHLSQQHICSILGLCPAAGLCCGTRRNSALRSFHIPPSHRRTSGLGGPPAEPGL